MASSALLAPATCSAPAHRAPLCKQGARTSSCRPFATKLSALSWHLTAARTQRQRQSVIVRAEEAAVTTAESVKEEEPPKPTLKKGLIVRVDKETYLASVEFMAVDHPPYFKGLDYIYEARGEVLDVRFFESGEYALIAWAGIPTAPAWLPATMLHTEKALSYKRT